MNTLRRAKDDYVCAIRLTFLLCSCYFFFNLTHTLFVLLQLFFFPVKKKAKKKKGFQDHPEIQELRLLTMFPVNNAWSTDASSPAGCRN